MVDLKVFNALTDVRDTIGHKVSGVLMHMYLSVSKVCRRTVYRVEAISYTNPSVFYLL
jgi:hypothetical protein